MTEFAEVSDAEAAEELEDFVCTRGTEPPHNCGIGRGLVPVCRCLEE